MILPSIKKVGKMKLHKDIHLDHVMLYMDCDKDLTFKDKINSLVQTPARKFVIEQTDKVKRFIERFREVADKNIIEKQVETLAKEFVYESSEMNLVHFNKLDKEIMDVYHAQPKLLLRTNLDTKGPLPQLTQASAYIFNKLSYI